jgi:hypothetical protein
VGEESSKHEPGWISVTRIGVLTTSRKREPVNARTAALVAQYTLPPAYGSLPAIEPRLMTWPALRALKSVFFFNLVSVRFRDLCLPGIVSVCAIPHGKSGFQKAGGNGYRPLISNCVREMRPRTFVANIASMSLSKISPTRSMPCAPPALLTALSRRLVSFYGYVFPSPEIVGVINAHTEDIDVAEFLWDFGPQRGHLGFV